MLGENILKLRKKIGLSQEQLGEQVNVTRQTISHWELNETAPNPQQLKLLSKTLHVSVDELLDNEMKSISEEKIGNTGKPAGIIIKILKMIGIILLIGLALNIIAVACFTAAEISISTEIESYAITTCILENKKYEVEFGTDRYLRCENCSGKMLQDLKEVVDSDDIDQSLKNIGLYFKDKNGTCE